MAQMVQILLSVQETWVQFLDWEDPLEEGMATHSSTLAWRIPWTEELFAALWTVARQASLSSGVLQARYWNVLANTSCHTLPTSVQFSPSVVSDSL